MKSLIVGICGLSAVLTPTLANADCASHFLVRYVHPVTATGSKVSPRPEYFQALQVLGLQPMDSMTEVIEAYSRLRQKFYSDRSRDPSVSAQIAANARDLLLMRSDYDPVFRQEKIDRAERGRENAAYGPVVFDFSDDEFAKTLVRG